MDSLSVYRELAECYDRLGQASMRDRFLILAADAALESGQADEAERLRQRLLQGSRHHMLRPYASFSEAVRAADVQTYLRDLRLNYPLDVAGQLLESLQGTTANAALHETRPVSRLPTPDPASPIPPTAPLLDMGSQQQFQGGDLSQQWQRSVPPVAPRPEPPESYPVLEETPAPAPVSRPADEPSPARPPVSRPAGGTNRPAVGTPATRPALAVPVAPLATPPAAPPTEALPAARRPLPGLPAPASSVSAPPESAVRGGTWVSGLLFVVVVLVGLACAAFTLARPLLPPQWLP